MSLVASGAGFVATTTHYTLHLDGFDAAEAENLAILAELATEGFAASFGAATAGPLEAFVAADQAGFQAQLAADGLGPVEGAGGYYEPSNGRAYLYRQPPAYYSRVLLLHELVHQWQDAVETNGGLPVWYVEGLAEGLSRHHWDGACLQLRVRPLLCNVRGEGPPDGSAPLAIAGDEPDGRTGSEEPGRQTGTPATTHSIDLRT